MLKVCVTHSPEKGKANKAIVEVLSKSLGFKKSRIELIAGATSRHKRFLIRHINVEELAGRISRSTETV